MSDLTCGTCSSYDSDGDLCRLRSWWRPTTVGAVHIEHVTDTTPACPEHEER